MNQFLKILALLLTITSANAQAPYRYQAEVGKSAANGFARIELPGTVLGQLNQDRSDIRLLTAQGKEVPYLLKQEQAVQQKALFREYEIVQKESKPKAGTTLVLRNPARTKINNLSLVIKNAQVRKNARLSGSADAQNWYVVREAYTLQSPASSTETSELQLLDFPWSDYEYYRLEIDDSTSAPLNILRAGYYDQVAENGKYTSLGRLPFTQSEKLANHQTEVWITFSKPVQVDKIAFQITEPAYFHRNAALYQVVTATNKKGKSEERDEQVAQLTLTSTQSLSFLLPDVRGSRFRLVIENGDNPPLTIGSIEAFHLNTYLVAELKKDETYRLTYGNPEASAPAYDLAYFEANIPGKLAVVQVKNEKSVEPESAAASPVFFTSHYFIWGALALVIGILAYFSVTMLREVGQKKVS